MKRKKGGPWSSTNAAAVNCHGTVQKVLEAWTLIYLEYFTTSNAPMRVRLIMSCPVMAQTSISYSQATAEVVESSLPISPEPHGTNKIREGGPNIATSVVGGMIVIQWEFCWSPWESQRRNPWILALILSRTPAFLPLRRHLQARHSWFESHS